MEESPRVFNASPLAIGFTGFRDPTPRGAFVAKLTLDICGDGSTRVGSAQDELCGDVCSDAHAALLYASDFVPYKTSAEFLVTGHAHAADPTHEIDVTVSVASITRQAIARSVIPTTRIPLLPAFLHDPTAPRPTILGVRRGYRVRHGNLGAGPLDPREDFNAADPAQRLDTIDESAEFRAWNLFDLNPAMAFRLPGLRPYVFIGSPSGPRPLPMRLDTVWIDADEAQVLLVWRSSPLRFPDDVGDAHVALGPAGEPLSWSEVEWRTQRESPRLASLPSIDPLDPPQVPAIESTAPHTAADVPMRPPDSHEADPDDFVETLTLGVTPMSKPLPFRSPERVDTGTGVVEEDLATQLRRAVLPFVSGLPAPPEPPPISAPPRPAPLPPPPVAPPPSMPPVILQSQAAPQPPSAPPPAPLLTLSPVLGPPPSTPAWVDPAPQALATPSIATPTPPSSESDLDHYVDLRVSLEGASDTAAALAQHGLDAIAWQRMDRTWRRRIALDASVAGQVRAALQRRRSDARDSS